MRRPLNYRYLIKQNLNCHGYSISILLPLTVPTAEKPDKCELFGMEIRKVYSTKHPETRNPKATAKSVLKKQTTRSTQRNEISKLESN